MTLWSDDTAAGTELWAALMGEKKCISENKHLYNLLQHPELWEALYSASVFYSILVEEPLCTGAIQTHSGIYITQGNLPSCLKHLIFICTLLGTFRFREGRFREVVCGSQGVTLVPPAHWNWPHLSLFIQQLFKLSLVTVGFHHNTHQFEAGDKKVIYLPRRTPLKKPSNVKQS